MPRRQQQDENEPKRSPFYRALENLENERIRLARELRGARRRKDEKRVREIEEAFECMDIESDMIFNAL